MLSTLLLSASSFQTVQASDLKEADKTKKSAVLLKIANDSAGGESVVWNSKKGIPSFVTGKLSRKKVKTVDDALSIMDENRDLFELETAKDELRLMEHIADEYGQMYKFQQVYKGVPVYGHQIILHSNRQQEANSVNGYYDPEVKIKKVNTAPTLTANEALSVAIEAVGMTEADTFEEQTAELNVFPAKDGSHHLGYVVSLASESGTTPLWEEIIVDAHDGQVIKQYSKIHFAATTGTGTGVLGQTRTLKTYQNDSTSVYELRDTTKPMTTTGTWKGQIKTQINTAIATDSDNIWSDPNAVDAHYYSGIVYDYYKKLGRDSYNNQGSDMFSMVRVPNTDPCNAYYTLGKVTYGDGNGTTCKAQSGALDIVGHEWTHGVIFTSASLDYSQDQPGALHESWSDAMGNLIENKPNNDWTLGEDVGVPSRSMSNPAQYGHPDHMSEFIPNADQHINAGIPNKAFYLFVTSSGMTRDNAAKVWLRAMTQYMTSNSQFIDARSATIQASTDVLGNATAVTQAWNAVGVGYSGGTVDSYEPNNTKTAAYGPINSGTPYNGLISSTSDEDWYKINAGAGSIKVTLTNLPADYELHLLDTNGTVVGSSTSGGTTSESISYYTSSNATFYIKVYGYNGATSSTQAYNLTATFVSGSAPSQTWYYENRTFDTPHPYANNYNNGTAHTYTKAGASKVGLFFTKLDTETGYDKVYIKDKSGATITTLDGLRESFWVEVSGDTITANFVTDSSVTKWGYSITQVKYYQ